MALKEESPAASNGADESAGEGQSPRLQCVLLAEDDRSVRRYLEVILQRAGYHKTLVAIANKHARIIWALLARGETFDGAHMAKS